MEKIHQRLVLIVLFDFEFVPVSDNFSEVEKEVQISKHGHCSSGIPELKTKVLISYLSYHLFYQISIFEHIDS